MSSKALYEASVKGDASSVGDLIARQDVEIEWKDNLGNTPLLVAALYGREAVVRALLKAGADKDTADDRGWTPGSAAERQA